MTKNIDISVITPSFNMLKYLKSCVASVQDQTGGLYEHLVIDGGSADGTVDWLCSQQDKIKSICEKDKGMYDAINKGLNLAGGSVVSYLNCDEQYLPGTLEYVKDYFTRNPDVDMIFGDVLLIKPDGELIAYRKGYKPRWYYIITSHLYVLSCTMFFRRQIIEDGLLFNAGLRAVGDADFVVRILRRGYTVKHIRKYLSVFIMTGENLSTDSNAIKERQQFQAEAPLFVKLNKLPLNVIRLTEKVLSGAYFQKMPLRYSVYTGDNEKQRKSFCVDKASFRWKF